MSEDEDLPGETSEPPALTPLPVDPDVTVSSQESVLARSETIGQELRQTLASRWDILLVIAVGGSLGSLARWGLGEALPTAHGSFPWSTFLENVSGAFVLGVLMVFVIDVWPPSRYVRPFFGVGVLGGFTTFSTYLLDTRSLVVADRVPLAGVYLFGSLAAGLCAVWLGISLARIVARAGRGQGPAPFDGRPA